MWWTKRATLIAALLDGIEEQVVVKRANPPMTVTKRVHYPVCDLFCDWKGRKLRDAYAALLGKSAPADRTDLEVRWALEYEAMHVQNERLGREMDATFLRRRSAALAFTLPEVSDTAAFLLAQERRAGTKNGSRAEVQPEPPAKRPALIPVKRAAHAVRRPDRPLEPPKASNTEGRTMAKAKAVKRAVGKSGTGKRPARSLHPVSIELDEKCGHGRDGHLERCIAYARKLQHINVKALDKCENDLKALRAGTGIRNAGSIKMSLVLMVAAAKKPQPVKKGKKAVKRSASGMKAQRQAVDAEPVV